MPYEKIQKRLSKSGIPFEIVDLKQTHIVEYMVLEAAGILAPFKNTALVCSYKSSYSSEYSFTDKEPRSTIKLSLNIQWDFDTPLIDEAEREKFINLANSIQHKFRKSKIGHSFSALYEIIMRDKDINKAIKASSIYIATGNLSSLNLPELLLLQKKLELYKNAGAPITDKLSIADTLIEKIRNYVNKKYTEEVINEALPNSQKQFTAYQALLEQERAFNQLFIKLQIKIIELSSKGKEFLNANAISSTNGGIHNLQFVPGYEQVAEVANTLNDSLKTARENFFKLDKPLTLEKVKAFETSCKEAINAARDEFSKFRNGQEWYNELHPILKDILYVLKVLTGILAAVLIIPMVLTEKYAPQGFYGTFFQKNQPSSQVELESFEEGVSDVMEKLHSAVTTMTN
jgi:hypothetical protein